LGTMCTCEEIERGTHAYRASKLGPVERWWTQDGKLGITIQDPSPESGRRTHLLYFTYSYWILSRVWKLITLLLLLRHYEHLFLFSMLKHVTSSWFCLYLLNIYHSTYTFSHAHTEAHTHAHMYNQHTRGMETTRHRSLVERGGWKALLETLQQQTKNLRKNPIFRNLKKRFEHIELPAKLLDYFLQSNESNINQWSQAREQGRRRLHDVENDIDGKLAQIDVSSCTQKLFLSHGHYHNQLAPSCTSVHCRPEYWRWNHLLYCNLKNANLKWP